MVDQHDTPKPGEPWADEQLLPAEKILLAAAKAGETARIRTDLEDPNEGEWPAFTADHEIRGELIRHMLIDPDAYQLDPIGFEIEGAYITDYLYLQYLTIDHLLVFRLCMFNAAPVLLSARTRTLIFQACRLPGLQADGLLVGGGLSLLHCQINGEVRLVGAKVSGNLECAGTSFSSPNGLSFTAQRLTVTDRVFWMQMKQPPTGWVDFNHATVGDFLDDEQSWPQKRNLRLDGFTYDNITTGTSAEQRIRWLALMPDQWNREPAYFPQPYEQLIKVFKATGHERDARRIAIAKQKALRKYLRLKATIKNTDAQGNDLTSYAKCDQRYARRTWLWFTGWAIGYGYESWRAARLLVGVLVFGLFAFLLLDINGLMEPAKERIYTHACYTDKTYCPHWIEIYHHGANGNPRYVPPDYPDFNAFTYSLDVLLPIVDMKLETHWVPGSRGFWGALGRAYFWLHIALGWIFTTIAVVGFTGMVKQDKD